LRSIVGRVVALAAVGLVVTAAPAAADAAKPGDFSSEVTSVEPQPDGLDVHTSGGDSFLTVEVDEGHELVVEGYEGEPYLRINADGTVEENQSSPATFINSSRYGTNELAPAELQGLSADELLALDPDWKQVATGGTYSWHDHRTHFMGAGDVPVARGEDFPEPWTVPMTFDGEAVVVTGTITFHEDVSPLPWYALAVLVAAALGVFGVRLPKRVPPALVAVVALAATIVAYIGFTSLPSGAGGSIVPAVVGAIALVLGVVGVLLERLRAVALLAGGVFLATWGVFRLAVLSNPVLPTDVPFALERLVTALALGVGIGAVVLAFRSGALTIALLPLDEDDGAADPTPA
jgi:hypothetical protein